VLALLAHVLADPEKYEDEVETAFAALLSITVSSVRRAGVALLTELTRAEPVGR
jgi:hypothetical protein